MGGISIKMETFTDYLEYKRQHLQFPTNFDSFHFMSVQLDHKSSQRGRGGGGRVDNTSGSK